MPITLTSREFNQDTTRAKREATKGPVFITDRGRPTHVLLSRAEYESLIGATGIAALLAWPGVADVDLPLERRRDFGRVVDLG